MQTQWLWSVLRFIRDVAALMAAALALAAILGLLQEDWTTAAIQNTLYAGSVLFVVGMVLLGLYFFRANAWQAAGVPSPWVRWPAWWPRAMLAGFLVFLLGLWLQGTILGEWVALPKPPV
jgi:hypothetical protein